MKPWYESKTIGLGVATIATALVSALVGGAGWQEAVLDERTTEICRFLHGKTVSVSTGLGTFEQVEAEPDRVKDLTPWVREAIDPESGRKVLFVERGVSRTRLTEVVRSAVGSRDERRELSWSLSERALAGAGIGLLRTGGRQVRDNLKTTDRPPTCTVTPSPNLHGHPPNLHGHPTRGSAPRAVRQPAVRRFAHPAPNDYG